MIGIILAAGSGSRMFPSTHGFSKHFCPVYDKPLFYYPLSLLLLLKIKKIIIIVNKGDLETFKIKTLSLIKMGLDIKLVIQNKSRGIPDAILSAKKYISKNKCCIILGDNIFYGQNFRDILNSQSKVKGASIFTYKTNFAKDYAVAKFKNTKVVKIIEKPKNNKNKNVVTGMYFFDQNLIELCKKIKPSKRNELEICDVLNLYIEKKILHNYLLGRGFTWFDAGTPKRLLRASSFIEYNESFTGLKIACLEEIILNNKWISKSNLKKIVKTYPNSDYKKYIMELI
ncbi:sugar phosphate nucleotidyltransferase [Candidatus Pelagibacter sp.]|jgi:glucose-1-phosphate thymidylyltransferase|nr:sugar phosphate nucleotidyltransferase [Candidatus Pelagibacter sp.]